MALSMYKKFSKHLRSFWKRHKRLFWIESIKLAAVFVLFLYLRDNIPFLNKSEIEDDRQNTEEAPLIFDENIDWWVQLKTVSDPSNIGNYATIPEQHLSRKEQEKAAQYSNLGFILNPDYAKKHKIDPKIVQFKKNKCLSYIDKFLKTAKEEARLFGIPVAITLAQGLLESNAGDSKLSRLEHNHFGIKCRNKCLGCRCVNYTDDSIYDMFRSFKTDWESFREHSRILMGERYAALKKINIKDYKGWAHGLRDAGYATDKKYAHKLIKIIEKLNLHRYDT